MVQRWKDVMSWSIFFGMLDTFSHRCSSLGEYAKSSMNHSTRKGEK